MSQLEATILPSSPRAAVWREVFGSETVPILSPLPQTAQTPRGDAEFYRLDVARLSDEQRKRVVSHLCQKWQLRHEEVVRLVNDPDHGVPLLAADLVVPLDLRLFT